MGTRPVWTSLVVPTVALLGTITLADNRPATSGDTRARAGTNITSSSGKRQVFRTPKPPREAKLGDVWVNPVDSAEMVYVPAGEFLMGSQEEEGQPDEHPRRRVYLDAYWIDKAEVTVGAYRRFCQAAKRDMPRGRGSRDDLPIEGVSWDDAVAYARWCGERLPTEAEWEKAARGTEGLEYPWGSEWGAEKCANKTSSNGRIQPVGTYPAGASPYGALDMAGNVWERCADWYDEEYYRSAPGRNPSGPAFGHGRVLRGGCCENYGTELFRAASRAGLVADGRNPNVGFRCVRGPE